MMTRDLEQQVARLTATEDIRNVIARYAKAGDDQNNPDEMRKLLAKDAVWEAKGFGKFEGRDLIAEKLAAIGREMIVWSLHFPVSPIIDIAEDLTTAHAFWWLWELTTMRGDEGAEESNWLAATYECDFVCAADGWKIKHLVLEVKKVVPYQDVPSEIAP